MVCSRFAPLLFTFMRVRFPLLFIAFLLCFLKVFAQKTSDFKQPRILILLDGSSSMVETWNGGTSRFKAASEVITSLMDSIYKINADVEFSLRVYGHQHSVPEHNCTDTRREVMFSKSNLTQMALRLESLHPIGVSPIAYSLKMAAENDFTDEREYAYSLVLITDGGESCNGNICEVVQELLEKKIQFKPYIVSLVDYAPLKEQYTCLGNYLQVTKPEEMKKAIGTISESYRKVLAIPIPKPKPVAQTSTPLPSVLKINIPEIKLPEKTPEPKPAAVVKDTVVKVIPPKPSKIIVDAAPLKHEEIPRLKPRKIAPLRQMAPIAYLVKKQSVPSIKIPEKQAELIVLPKEEMAYLKPRRNLGLLQYFYAIPKLKPLAIPSINIPAKEAEPAPVAVVPPPPPPPPPRPAKNTPVVKPKDEMKEAAFTTEIQPADNTTLQLYFTNGTGKFYQTNPRVMMVDAQTKKEVKRFFRTVNVKGEPDGQQLPPGTYNIMFEANPNLIVKNVVIAANENRKVYVTITKGTLRFEYEGNTKRPIEDFVAEVKRNFEPAPTVMQPLTEAHSYEPGNYHIEINTLPIDRRNIDLDFGATYYIRLFEPGFVQFMNSVPLGKVALYYPLGDQYEYFYKLDVTGKPEAQKLRLQPGTYKVQFFDSKRREVIKTFRVMSNQTTQLEL